MIKFVIPGRMPDLNDFIGAERTTIRRDAKSKVLLTKGAVMKKQWGEYVAKYIRLNVKNEKATKPFVIHYHYYEPDARRDCGNIHGFCQKITEDALQKTKTIPNDNQTWLKGFTADFQVDKLNPRIEVEIEEIDNEQC